MKKLSFTIICCFLGVLLNSYAQPIPKEIEYAEKISRKVKRIQPHYRNLLSNQLKSNKDTEDITDISFLNIYTIYATKRADRIQRRLSHPYSSKLLKWMISSDSLRKDDFLSYIDPRKIDCNHCLLFRDSSYIGMMIPYVNKKEEWQFKNSSFYLMDITKMKALFKIISKIKPDFVFEVCQDFTYFFIIDKRIYGIVYDYDKEEYFMLSLKEYIEKIVSIEPMKEHSIELIDREYQFGVKYPTWKE